MNSLKFKTLSILLLFLVIILLFMSIWNYIIFKIQNKKNRIFFNKNIEKQIINNYILLDLGSNNGDSILSFFELQSRFPQFIEKSFSYKNFGPEATAAQWKIYAFEANSKFDSDLEETERIIRKITNNQIKVFKQTAAWIYDGKIGFYVENSTGFGLGSSLYKKHPDVIKTGSTKTLVNCRDIAKFVKSFDINDFIVMKIDIEGAEYELILDFIKKDAIKWIDHFVVEYHSQIKKFDSPELLINDILKLYGASVSRWI